MTGIVGAGVENLAGRFGQQAVTQTPAGEFEVGVGGVADPLLPALFVGVDQRGAGHLDLGRGDLQFRPLAHDAKVAPLAMDRPLEDVAVSQHENPGGRLRLLGVDGADRAEREQSRQGDRNAADGPVIRHGERRVLARRGGVKAGTAAGTPIYSKLRLKSAIFVGCSPLFGSYGRWAESLAALSAMATHRSAMIERRQVLYSGHVQGVGFRETTRRLAEGFAVGGFVRNLADGRVEMIAEGTPAELSRFLAAIADRMAGHIRQTAVDVRPGLGEFDGFHIRH